MQRPPEWQSLDHTIREGIHKNYKQIVQNVNQSTFPRRYRFPDLLEMRGVQTDYSCSLEMARLGLVVQGISSGLTDHQIASAICLSTDGADQYDLLRGMQSLGVDCQGREGLTTTDLTASLQGGDAIEICSMQQPAYAKKSDLMNTLAGHYMAAFSKDALYFQFADPGEFKGITRVLIKYMSLLWHDVEIATGRIVYGFSIRVPIKVS